MIWPAFLACLVVSFTFSGIESGVLSVNRVRLRHYARRGEEAAQNLDRLLTRIERLMMTVVLMTNAANIVAISILYMQFTKWMGPFGAIAALAVALPVFIFGLEFLPKAIFRRFPYRTLVVFARILTAADWLLAPVTNLAGWIVRPFFRAGREVESGRIVSVEGLKRTIAQAEPKGQRPATERSIIEHIIDFRALRAGDLMMPLDRVPQAGPDTPIADLLRRASELDASRFLVIESNGDVGGLVRVIDLLFDGVRSGRVQSYMRRVVTVKSGERAMTAVRKLRASRLPVAVVLDADGRPAGLLTSDHLVRRLLGGDK
ncbi:MAG: CNNM domain-containing protein [Terrimicrobiaceae bacterium]|nr:CNNM domain-containing protein [Terrimicrobiaceae bacterium]